MADQGLKNNSGKIEFYQDSNLVFTIRDDTSALYMTKNTTTGDFETKKTTGNAAVITIREA